MALSKPRVVIVSRWWRADPFLSSLYAAMSSRGWEVREGSLKEFVLGRRRRDRSCEIFHLNWIDHVSSSEKPLARMSSLAKFASLLAVARVRRRRIWWTVHNLKAHERPDSGTYRLAVRIGLTLVWRVHHLSATALESQRHLFPLVSRQSKRRTFQTRLPGGHLQAQPIKGTVRTGPVKFVAFGLMRPSKGVVRLVKSFVAFRENAPGHGVELTIAGRPISQSFGTTLTSAKEDDTRVTLMLESLSDEDLVALLSEADWALFPYDRITNSGALVAALELGVPVIGSDLPFFNEIIGRSAAGIIYDWRQPLQGHPWADWVEEAVEERSSGQRRSDALMLAARHDPEVVVERILTALGQNGHSV